MGSEALDQLLDDDLAEHDPVMLGHLSNHLPMALIALHAMGADDTCLREYANNYRSKLDQRRPLGQSIGLDDTLPLGSGVRYTDLLDRFDREISAVGVQPVLDRHLGPLLEGLGGAAFHGVIRLGYAIEHGRSTDVSAGLAVLADCHLPIEVVGTGTATKPTADPQQLLDEVAAHSTIAGHSQVASGFQNAFGLVATDPTFRSLASGFVADEDSLGTIARASHRLYRATANFFALHCVTATHATRLATEHMTEPAARLDAVTALGRAAAAAYTVIGAPTAGAEPADDPGAPDWSQIRAEAVRQDDEHVIKIVYTSACEELRWEDPTYRYTAARAVGL